MKRAAYPKYKVSGVEWLGQVPEEWEIKAIKWESHVQRGASPRPIDNPVYFDDDGEYSWVRISDVTSAGMYLETTEQKLSELGSSLSVKMQPGSLFLSIAGSVGKPCITKIKSCIHDGFVYFPRWKGDARYLYYIFASGEPYKGLGKMGTQLNLNTDTVGGIILGLPSRTEQTVIADFLDRETGRIDTLVAKKHALIALLKEKRSALISRTVTRGLPAAVAREFGLEPHTCFKDSGVEWLGEVPEGWEYTRLKYATERIVDCPHETPVYSVDGEYFVVRTADLTCGIMNLSAAYRIDEEEYQKRTRRERVIADDILYGREGERWGFAALAPLSPTVCLGQRMMQFRAAKHFCSGFLMWQLNARSTYEQGALDSTGSTSPHVNVDTIKNYLLTKPPFSEQTAIATYLDRETAKLDKLVEKIETAITRLQEYRTALITAAVTGKIDVRVVE